MKRFVGYDGESMQHFDTEAEACEFAERGLKCARDAAIFDGNWDCDEVVEIFWGEVKESVAVIAREPWQPDDDDGSHYSERLEYGLLPFGTVSP